ncbi:hypothetical protein B0T17DRAFT_592190 [Bombardia bombarda]|uniref:RING-type domain-containing protein n=1 Tax=Bombardia bombarda TaxID=252184 RepID=A0AA39WMZ9_9PEZI|nr:hypothetical protein B0T17DRAFT_592190 [Bombardia bombarda]
MSMSVEEIRNVVLLLSNPAWKGVGTIPSTVIRNITALSSRFAFSTRFTENITVLASKYAGTTNGRIQGLLYVPDILSGDPCAALVAPHVPDTAARRADLPPANYNLIAIVPWVSAECSQTYLTSARKDPIRGMIFYQPDNTTSTPPPPDDPVWDLQDEGRWRTQSGYPIYAVSGQAGHQMMYQLSLYSGDLDTVPFGQNISDYYNPDPNDYVRVWTELVVTTPSTLPGIWVYILIIAGVLLAIIGGTSFMMHFAQSRRRAALKRRVIAGQVNLEGLGIKRLTVPMEHIQTFPLPRRSSRDPLDGVADKTTITRVATISEKGLSNPSAAFAIATDYQPVCAVCLEPYQNRVTVIRELPCGHIFHPECIDEFLHEVSSLCPLCKASMLPKGYCPKITNIMVRREHAVRRLRERIVVEESFDETITTNRGADGGGGGMKRRGWGNIIKYRMFGATNITPTSSTSTELQTHPQPRLIEESQLPPLPLSQHRSDASGRESPTDLARKRMRELAGAELDDDGEEEAQLTRWKRVRNKVFPGF